MPDRALYYPQTTIWDPRFLVDAMLYWDNVACIVPVESYRERRRGHPAEMQAAMRGALDEFSSNLVPSDNQKRQAHEWLRETLIEGPAQRGETILWTDFFADKASPQTLELLLHGGWLKDCDKPAHEVERYVEQRKAGGKLSPEFGGYTLRLPKGITSLVMSALAAACSSEHMPPVTDDEYLFQDTINSLLNHQSSATGVTQVSFEYKPDNEPADIAAFSPRLGEALIGRDLRCLFATVPRLGQAVGQEVTPETLKNLTEARKKDDVRERQRAFREVVDRYLTQLRDAEDNERDLIVSDFKEAARRDLSVLKKELNKLSLWTLTAKEGSVGLGIGYACGMAAATNLPESMLVGSILGLTRSLIRHARERDKVLGQHWCTWAMTADNRRFRMA
ncbi:hypothetical protein [Botrimarina mediterranea]|uniref:Uncharacterized protein n=1 Tax=Botrimarina mediterranea TaxID=2528022 RepID=A0A518K621_9BACT|nr:hypothetical protein [Botrimarina mediterranea]QDV73242.1 hypothetical protein Spa11_14380 [Botrimarina mediterranea]